ncbi:Dipeptidyl aminopeptidase, partial [Pichia californica]
KKSKNIDSAKSTPAKPDKSESESVVINNDLGYYLHQDGNVLNLRQAADANFEKKIIDLSSLTYMSSSIKGARLISVNKSLTKIIVASEMKQKWRHSSTGKYWLVDVNTLEIVPVYGKETKDGGLDPVELNYAAFSPDGNFIHINYGTNILLKNIKNGKITQVTENEDEKDIIDGKPDWVYEEEVLGSDRALYWSQDSSKFSFIRWDDTDVPVYNLEFFGYDKYPEIEALKYPKPGFSNPIVSLYVYQVSNSKLIKVKQPEEQDKTAESLGNDFIIYQVAWLNSDELIFKRTDRTSRKIQVCVFSVKSGKTVIVRSIDTSSYDGWYKNNGDIFVLPNNKGYIDNVVDEHHDHLSYFKSSTDTEGDVITSGDWDVIGGVLGYDEIDNSVYFIGTSGNSLQRQIYKVSIDTSVLTGLTNLDDIHSYSLKVSKGGKYGLMKYEGPQLPMQKIVELNKLTEENYYDNLPNLNNAEEVSSYLEKYAVPIKEYIPMQLHDNTTINVIEVKPQNFDENKQYPILISVYGGPGIQKVNCNFNYGFEEIVASSLDAIVLYIDPRGTGGSSWEYRSWARDNIGYWEPKDIIEATQTYIEERDYVDMERVAIWGWSYGGFTTLKTLEVDKGITFKYGMAVAPVTNWYLYDSIYTERYMGSPKDHEYKDAKISNVKNFQNIYRFLIMHGTGDDNVHYQNTLQLLNDFDLNGVENYDIHVFPDSDHSIAHDNANVIVYDKLISWLTTAFST